MRRGILCVYFTRRGGDAETRRGGDAEGRRLLNSAGSAATQSACHLVRRCGGEEIVKFPVPVYARNPVNEYMEWITHLRQSYLRLMLNPLVSSSKRLFWL